MPKDLAAIIDAEMSTAIQMIAGWVAIMVLCCQTNSVFNKTNMSLTVKNSETPDREEHGASFTDDAGGINRTEYGERILDGKMSMYNESGLSVDPITENVTTEQFSTWNSDKSYVRNSLAETSVQPASITKDISSEDESDVKLYHALGHLVSDLRHQTRRDVSGKVSGSSKYPVSRGIARRHLRARQEGDAIIGAMFPLHRNFPEVTNMRQCGNIWEHYGIQRVEAFIMTIEKINKDTTLLPNIKLGWDIRDSCWNSAIALENSIDFIKDAIYSVSTRKEETNVNSSSANDSHEPCKTTGYLKPIIGLIGPGSSDTSVHVQNLLQIFKIPQIGYSATVNSLSEKSEYQYYMRVVPPDKYQAQAIVEFIRHFKWTYISAVHTLGTYGYKGMDQLKTFAKNHGICIAEDLSITNRATEEEYDKMLEILMKHSNANVVVCFCEGETVSNLFKATRRKNVEGRFLIIGSDGWGNRQDVVKGVESAAVGAISFMFYSPPLTDFAPRYESLTVDNPKNPWFTEFWEDKFNCSLDENNRRKYNKLCTGNEKLSSENPDSKLGFVANAVMTMAHALDTMHHDLCPGHTGLCPAMEPVNGSLYWQYLLNVSFLSYNNELVQFDINGDPPGRYEIRNYQRVVKEDGDVTYEYVNIGDWKNINLTVYANRIQWPPGVNGTVRDEIVSVCSLPCPSGHKQSTLNDKCCWSCQLCKDNEITTELKDNCTPCELGLRPNLNKTECEDIPVQFISWGETEAIVCISLACLGISVTMWIFVIFLRYKDTPMVKASTRELSYIILVGICLAFSANFFIVAKPTREFCYITRILPGLSFSLMYGALVTRTNRIARILEGSKRIMTKKPKFMSATAQVVITGIIISIECAVIIAMLVYQPADSKIDYLSLTKARLICDTSNSGIVVPLGFDLVLIILCTIYAVKTRNLPENFNEAKFIGFTMYSTCVIWLGFFPIYFAGENKEITLSISMSLSAAIAILLLFIPKVYVIIWVPEKNTRGAFTTSRDVRCHIGSKSMASGDSIDIKESNTYENLYKSDKGHNKNWKQKSLDEKRLRFVMQRSGGNSGGSPYINHGVLPSLSGIVRSTAFVNRDNSSDSTRTVSTPISSASVPDKEKVGSKEQWENPGVEAIRQSLVRDFPLPSGRRQLSLRPGSPAEKEKHRIHNIAVTDLDELLSSEAMKAHNRHGKPRDFRKSLSSNCVSTCQKTRTAECQTGEELAHFLLPPLRKRCVSRNKLERSGAVDDHTLTNTINTDSHSSKDVVSFHHKPHFLHSDPVTAQHPSCKSPLVICYTQDRHGLSSLPDLDCPRSPLLTNSRSHRRSSYHQPLLHHHEYADGGCCSNEPLPPRLTIPGDHQHRHSTSRLLTPDSSDFSFLDGVEAFESSISPCYSDAAIRSRLRRFPVPGISPSSRCGDCSDTTNASNQSLLQDDSGGSLMTASTASSSFTLPPFQTSTDSNHSLCELDNADETFNDTVGGGYYGDNNGHEDDNDDDDDDDEEELVNIHHNATAPLMGDNSHKSNRLDRISPLLSLDPLEQEETEVLEFQKYLQGHGVKLDISTIQSSDL